MAIEKPNAAPEMFSIAFYLTKVCKLCQVRICLLIVSDALPAKTGFRVLEWFQVEGFKFRLILILISLSAFISTKPFTVNLSSISS